MGTSIYPKLNYDKMSLDGYQDKNPNSIILNLDNILRS